VPRRFDHGVLGDAQPHALARLDEVVAEVVVARQPDASFDHRELAAEAPEPQRLAGGDALHRAGGGP
jgi:hypothetical protein